MSCYGHGKDILVGLEGIIWRSVNQEVEFVNDILTANDLISLFSNPLHFKSDRKYPLSTVIKTVKYKCCVTEFEIGAFSYRYNMWAQL